MICPECREAGGMNRLFNTAAELRKRAVALDFAVHLHGRCDGRCDCQHKTGLWISNGKEAK